MTKSLRAGAKLRSIPDAHGEPLAPLNCHREVVLADAAINHVLDCVDIDAVACRCLTINLNVYVRSASDLLCVHIGGARNSLEHGCNLARTLFQLVEVTAEYFDAYFRSYAR